VCDNVDRRSVGEFVERDVADFDSVRPTLNLEDAAVRKDDPVMGVAATGTVNSDVSAWLQVDTHFHRQGMAVIHPRGETLTRGRSSRRQQVGLQ
jgi:hypothetical protein